ncbi:MAG: hypothetical protein PGN15_03825 [Aeromicrobium erythreum]
MKDLGLSVVWRYAAIAVQFGLVVLVAQRLPLADAGVYFTLFGAVTVSSMLVGIGAPDGLVRLLPVIVDPGRRGTTGNKMLRRAVRVSRLTGIAGGLLVAVYCLASMGSSFVAVGAGIWWLGYSQVFLAAQILAGLNRAALAAFFAYSATNFAYCLTLVPYLVLAERPTLGGVVALAAAPTVAVAVVGHCMVRRALRGGGPVEAVGHDPGTPPEVAPGARASAAGVWHVGIPIMLTRIMQASLPWLPVWFLSAFASHEQAAVYAAASRLVVAVTAVIAALRFAVRPRIVRLFSEQEVEQIAKIARGASVASAVGPTIGLFCMLTVGEPLITTVLGQRYSGTSEVLTILLVGVLAECVGGVADEILKMTGLTSIVLMSLALAVGVQCAGGIVFGADGAVSMAWTTVVAFATQYVIQLVYLQWKGPVVVWPLGRNKSQRIQT